MGKKKGISPRKRTNLIEKQRMYDRNLTKTIVRSTLGPTRKEVASSANITVYIRIRPFSDKENSENCRTSIKVIDNDMLIFDPEEISQDFFFHGMQQKGRDMSKKVKKNIKFTFNRIFTSEATNDSVFEGTTLSLINTLMDGFNCSVFAYGATGAGKTFTMTGTAANPGITFLTITELFRKLNELSDERDFEIGITYLEVYNELVKDLLNAGPPLNLREDSNYGVIVAGLKLFKISNPEELFSLLEQGNLNRTQHPTDANAESSRSHAVFQVYLRMTLKRTKEIRTAKLSMIDLAGSERGSATGYSGARFTEGANINRSLLALGNCINSLSDGHKHVPYRDSKLTRLLKDSLGGNCYTIMIANVSPSILSYDDTYNTLKYATRANSIKSNIHRNIAQADMSAMQYKTLIQDLTKENQAQKDKIESLLKENEKFKSQLEQSSKFGGIDESVVLEIKELVKQKQELLSRQFQIEINENITTIKRLLKEDIDNRLSDFCVDTPEKEETREKLTSTITRCKKQESALRNDIEQTEDIIEGVDKKFNELETNYPQCQYLIQSERLKLSLLKAKHMILLEKRYSDYMVEEQETKSVLVEKMSNTMRNLFKLLKGHGILTPSIISQYKDVNQILQKQKSITWSKLPDSGISSLSSIPNEENEIENEQQVVDCNRTFVAEPIKTKGKICTDQLMSTGSRTLLRKVQLKSPAKRFPPKSPRYKENVLRPVNYVLPNNNTNSGKLVKTGILKSRAAPLTNNAVWRR